MVQKWMLGVSYQVYGRLSVCGMWPPNSELQPDVPVAEIRERHDRVPADAQHVLQHLRAAAASPAASATGSRSRRRRPDSRRGRCRRRPGSPRGPWRRIRSRPRATARCRGRRRRASRRAAAAVRRRRSRRRARLRARRHHVGDHQQVDARAARRARGFGHGEIALEPGQHGHRLPAAARAPCAAPSRKPRTIANSSGSSSRKASWPLSVTISANETRAPAALSACTMARESEVGNSQSRGERDHAEARRRALERVGEHAVIVGGEIEIVHRAREIEIGIGVEALDEGDALVAQIALHLEIGVEREGRIVAILELAAELAVQRGVRQIGDVRAHARDREPAPRIGALDQIAAAAPFRIGHHRLAADLVEGDVLRRMARRAGDRQRRRTRARG